MNNIARALVCVLLFTLSACAPIGIGGRTLTFPGKRVREFVGRLIEARCYLNTGATGDDHAYCAFRSAQGDQPLALLTDRNQLMFLTESPSRLASVVTQRVRVRGAATPNGQLLRPVSVAVWRDGNWSQISF